MQKISVVINTLNAERLLDKCLESVKDADEIIICDMHSEDKTVEIAQKYGCKIVYHERTGIVEPARNWAMEQAIGDWILVLDADEVVTPELWAFLKEYAQNPKEGYYACNMHRKTVLDGKILESWTQKECKRFWKKGVCTYTDSIHQMPITHEGKDFLINDKKMAIIHYHIPSLSSYIEKTDRYTDFELKKFETKGKKFSLFKLLTRPCYEFFKIYILKGGIFDGVHGYIFAKMQSYYKLIQWAKLYEKEFKEKNDDLIY